MKTKIDFYEKACECPYDEEFGEVNPIYADLMFFEEDLTN